MKTVFATLAAAFPMPKLVQSFDRAIDNVIHSKSKSASLILADKDDSFGMVFFYF